ncbi:Cytochrome c oxidase subunit 6 [Pseudocyphellaria aurata]|nr:Cytochrome c oxidase subunit 6 [Pseudocyphellaria aurata]
MSSSGLIRLASRTQPSTFLRPQLTQLTPRRLPLLGGAPAAACVNGFSTSPKRPSDPHGEETFDEFTARYEKEFDGVHDVFELQRNLNNAFAYDLVPSTTVCSAALRAARRVNDFPTAVRIFEGMFSAAANFPERTSPLTVTSRSLGIKAKVENQGQYEEYLRELEPLRQELGVSLREDMYPDLRAAQPDRGFN